MAKYYEGLKYPATEFLLDVARNILPQTSFKHVFGRNPSQSISTTQDIWENGSTWVAPTVSRVHNIVSSDAADTLLGTGARTVTVSGISGGLVVSENINLNGLSDVATVNSYTMINSLKVIAAGSGLVNAGTITATAVTDATITAQINIGINVSRSSVYQTPDNSTGLLLDFYACFNDPSASLCIVNLLVAPPSQPFYPLQTIYLKAGVSGPVVAPKIPYNIPALSFIKVNCLNDANIVDVSAYYTIANLNNNLTPASYS